MTYPEKLKDPRWQKRRLQIMERDEFRCQHCYDPSSTLHVHHLAYLRKVDPWDYPDGFLITLCEPCHVRVEDAKQNIAMFLGDEVTLSALEYFTGLAASGHRNALAIMLSRFASDPRLLDQSAEQLIGREMSEAGLI